MYKLFCMVACLACTVHGRRVQELSQELLNNLHDPLEALALLLVSNNPTTAFSLTSPGARMATTGRISATSDVRNRLGSAGMDLKQNAPAWPDPFKGYRLVPEDDPAFREYVVNKAIGYVCQPPDTFQGTRFAGRYEGSYQLQFTLPGREDAPKTIEFKRSGDNNPTFAAVKISGNFGADVDFSPFQQRMVVAGIKDGTGAKRAKLLKGDIIRGISVPSTGNSGGGSGGGLFGMFDDKAAIGDSEDGLLILDGKLASAWQAALQESYTAYGNMAEILLLVERPGEGGGNGWWPPKGGQGEKVGPELAERLGNMLNPEPKTSLG